MSYQNCQRLNISNKLYNILHCFFLGDRNAVPHHSDFAGTRRNNNTSGFRKFMHTQTTEFALALTSFYSSNCSAISPWVFFRSTSNHGTMILRYGVLYIFLRFPSCSSGFILDFKNHYVDRSGVNDVNVRWSLFIVWIDYGCNASSVSRLGCFINALNARFDD